MTPASPSFMYILTRAFDQSDGGVDDTSIPSFMYILTRAVDQSDGRVDDISLS